MKSISTNELNYAYDRISSINGPLIIIGGRTVSYGFSGDEDTILSKIMKLVKFM